MDALGAVWFFILPPKHFHVQIGGATPVDIQTAFPKSSFDIWTKDFMHKKRTVPLGSQIVGRGNAFHMGHKTRW